METITRTNQMYTTEQQVSYSDFFKEIGYDWEKMLINEWVDVENLGYEILTSDGRWNKVRKIIRKDNALGFRTVTDVNILETSGDHKLFVKNIVTEGTSFTEVKNLLEVSEQYQVLENSEWKTFRVESLGYFIPIVDLELDGDHTYQSNEILSHNSFVPGKTQPGGNAMKFYATLRCVLLGKKYLTSREDITGNEIPYGAEVTVRTDKNKLGPPIRSVEMNLIFTKGIDEIDEWLTYLDRIGMVEGKGWRVFTDKFPLKSYVGTKFQKSSFKELLADNELYETCVKVIKQGFVKKIDDAMLKQEQENAAKITE